MHGCNVASSEYSLELHTAFYWLVIMYVLFALVHTEISDSLKEIGFLINLLFLHIG